MYLNNNKPYRVIADWAEWTNDTHDIFPLALICVLHFAFVYRNIKTSSIVYFFL